VTQLKPVSTGIGVAPATDETEAARINEALNSYAYSQITEITEIKKPAGTAGGKNERICYCVLTTGASNLSYPFSSTLSTGTAGVSPAKASQNTLACSRKILVWQRLGRRDACGPS
jgi:hypothetical protein